MFDREFLKWGFVGGLYETAALAAVRAGKLLSRKEFRQQAVLILLGPEDIGDLYAQGKRFQLVQAPMPIDPRMARAVPPQPPSNGKIVITG